MREELNRLEQLFDAARELASPEERAAYLGHACGADTALRQRVEKLLRAHETAGQFLSPDTPPAQSGLPFSDSDLPLSEMPGDQIGHYTLVERIGEGGCCVVYRAEQREPVRRQVALKLIKTGMDTRQVVARFEAERQTLALMDHPHIAKIFDAGVTPTGRPYFVMELVRGVPITQFCDEHRLTVKQRLELFMQVCHAVQHAHQKGIIHRDLKPSNILVATEDSGSARGPRAMSGGSQDTSLDWREISAGRRNPHASGVCSPMIIDFGIAKATQVPLTDRAVVTWVGQFVGTPAYMSPEQARMNSEDIDVRADIYSLGALLYELLTGVTPFDRETLTTATFDDIRRMIQETEPAKPSMRLTGLVAADVSRLKSTTGGERQKTAKEVRADSRRLLQEVRGDLDWIVMKTLEKDRQRRYATANDLAEDIRRHLEHEPVLAGPPGAGYRMRKFVRRHRVGVAVAAVVTLALLAGLSLALVGLQRALTAERQMRQERDRAVRAEADTRGILSLFDEKLGADEDRLDLHCAAVRLARERLEPTSPAAMNFILPLGRNLGRIGAWTNALDVYVWLTEVASWSCDYWTHAHAAALAAGQTHVSRRLRAEIVTRFGDTQDAITAMQVGRAVLTDPDFQEHLQAGVDCARRAYMAVSHDSWFQLVQGMAEYRRGQWAEASKVLQEAESAPDACVGAIAGCFRAMARHQAGETNAARETLSHASGQLRQVLHRGLLPSNGWHYAVFGLVARAEAERLLLGKEVSPPVTAESLVEARKGWKWVRDNLARGEALACEKQWKASGEAYVQALQHPAFDWAAAEEDSPMQSLSLQMGIAFARSGHRTPYADLCQMLLAQGVNQPESSHGKVDASIKARRYATTCCLNPEMLPAELRQSALEYARFAVAHAVENPGGTALSGAMAEHCFGEPERALELSQKAAKDTDPLVAAHGLLYQAMTFHKLNRPQEATEALQNAENLFAQISEKKSGATWWNLAQGELALQEARQLIRPPTTDP